MKARVTVQELIERLHTFPPTLTVVMPAESGGDLCVVEEAFIETVQLRNGAAQVADEREGDWTEVVRLFGPDETL